MIQTVKRKGLLLVVSMTAGLAVFPALSLGVDALPVNFWLKGYLSLLTLQAGTAAIVLSYLRWGKPQEK
jgi:hypothetical protein